MPKLLAPTSGASAVSTSTAIEEELPKVAGRCERVFSLDLVDTPSHAPGAFTSNVCVEVLSGNDVEREGDET